MLHVVLYNLVSFFKRHFLQFWFDTLIHKVGTATALLDNVGVIVQPFWLFFVSLCLQVKDEYDEFIGDYAGEVHSLSASEAFQKLKACLNDEILPTAQQAKVYTIEMFLARACKQVEKAADEGSDNESSKQEMSQGIQVINTNLAFLASNKYGVTEAMCNKHVIALARSKLETKP